MPSRPNHFEIPVDDPERAEKFYADVFGWVFQRFEGAPQYYGMATTGDENPGINGALYQRSPDNGSVVLTMGVDSIEAALERVTAAGGRIVQGKTPIPQMGYFANCEDTEGNRFGVFVEDNTATM